MDIKSILKARGLDDANADALISNPAYGDILKGFIQEAEQGKTALLNAQQIEQNLKTWNETNVIPYVQKADARVAETEGRLAAQSAYLKTLKEQGYEVPDSYLTTPPPAITTANQPSTQSAARDYSDDIMLSAKANMALISMSERARDLLGHGLDVESEYEDFGKNKRPGENLRGYITRKYDLDTLHSKREADKKQKYEDDIRAEAKKAAIAEYQQANGSNPETRSPRSSRFDRIVQDDTRKGLWQTAQGREEATKNRLAKYAGQVQ